MMEKQNSYTTEVTNLQKGTRLRNRYRVGKSK